jgi:hypothetical protein
VLKALLGQWLPNVILKLTNWVAFDAPQIPSEAAVTEYANKGANELDGLLKGFRDAAADMNTRCTTAGPTASLILAVGAILKSGLDRYEWLYTLLLVLAGVAVFSAITGQSVAVPFNRVGLEPDAVNVPAERAALLRKEAWARLASGMATGALLVLAIAALASNS